MGIQLKTTISGDSKNDPRLLQLLCLLARRYPGIYIQIDTRSDTYNFYLMGTTRKRSDAQIRKTVLQASNKQTANLITSIQNMSKQQAKSFGQLTWFADILQSTIKKSWHDLLTLHPEWEDKVEALRQGFNQRLDAVKKILNAECTVYFRNPAYKKETGSRMKQIKTQQARKRVEQELLALYYHSQECNDCDLEPSLERLYQFRLFVGRQPLAEPEIKTCKMDHHHHKSVYASSKIKFFDKNIQGARTKLDQIANLKLAMAVQTRIIIKLREIYNKEQINITTLSTGVKIELIHDPCFYISVLMLSQAAITTPEQFLSLLRQAVYLSGANARYKIDVIEHDRTVYSP